MHAHYKKKIVILTILKRVKVIETEANTIMFVFLYGNIEHLINSCLMLLCV